MIRESYAKLRRRIVTQSTAARALILVGALVVFFGVVQPLAAYAQTLESVSEGLFIVVGALVIWLALTVLYVVYVSARSFVGSYRDQAVAE